jgi:hypothetical protein
MWLEFVIEGMTLIQAAYHLPRGLPDGKENGPDGSAGE